MSAFRLMLLCALSVSVASPPAVLLIAELIVISPAAAPTPSPVVSNVTLVPAFRLASIRLTAIIELVEVGIKLD